MLDGCMVSDAGLKHIQGLVNLDDLWLRETKVTDQGVKELRTALSNLRITR